MNDATTRFAEDQTGAASLLPREEGNLPVTEIAESAVELNAWATEEGLRGADGARTLRWILPAFIRDGLRHHARIRVDPDIASPMERLRLHMATRIKFGA